MRGWIVVATLCASPGCDRASGRPAGGPAWGPGIEVAASTGEGTGDAARLDLGTQEPLPDLPAEESSSGSTGPGPDGSTGGVESGSSLGPDGETTGPDGGSSSTGEGSSTGEPPEPPAVCGDGLCEPSERSPCWATPKEAWCFIDCYQVPECESDCPCTPEAAAVKNFCAADPAPACAATAPGGYCELGDDVQGFYAWHAKCG